MPQRLRSSNRNDALPTNGASLHHQCDDEGDECGDDRCQTPHDTRATAAQHCLAIEYAPYNCQQSAEDIDHSIRHRPMIGGVLSKICASGLHISIIGGHALPANVIHQNWRIQRPWHVIH